MWERRTDLGGVELVDTVLEWQHFTMPAEPGGDFAEGAAGVFPDLLDVLQASLNFSVARRSPDDGEWGVLASNGSHEWMTGLSGDLQSGRADLCTAGQYLSPDRRERTEMVALLMDYVTVVMHESLLQGESGGGRLNVAAYLKIFPPPVWSLVLAFVAAVAALFLVDRICRQKTGKSDEVLTGLSEGLQVTFMALLQRGPSVDVDSSSAAAKAAFLTASMLAFILYSSYTSYIMALMTYRSPPVPLQSFQVNKTFYMYIEKNNNREKQRN